MIPNGISLQQMNNHEQLAFRALADPTRRQILLHLSQRDMTIGELVSEFSMTRAAVKKHLDILASGQMVSVHPRGRERVNRLQPDGIQSITDWLHYFDRIWDNKLNALQHAIGGNTSGATEPPEPAPTKPAPTNVNKINSSKAKSVKGLTPKGPQKP